MISKIILLNRGWLNPLFNNSDFNCVYNRFKFLTLLDCPCFVLLGLGYLDATFAFTFVSSFAKYEYLSTASYSSDLLVNL